MGKEEEAKQEEEAFAEEDIDQILAGRSEKRQIGSRMGNTFSTATFSTNEVLPRPCTLNCFFISFPAENKPFQMKPTMS